MSGACRIKIFWVWDHSCVVYQSRCGAVGVARSCLNMLVLWACLGPDAVSRQLWYGIRNPRDPSIQIIPTLGPKVCKYYLHWAVWIPRGIELDASRRMTETRQHCMRLAILVISLSAMPNMVMSRP